MHVALVDQSLTAQGTICDLLKGRGHTVYSFTNSRRALDRIRADAEIDGVIVDAEVGPISSAEFCWETRLLAGQQRAIYVLLMSSSPDEQLLIEGLDCGADDFIVKPPRSGELCAKLRVAERVVTVPRVIPIGYQRPAHRESQSPSIF